MTEYAGNDASKATLDVLVQGNTRCFDNNRPGFHGLANWLHTHEATWVTMEATGRDHRAVHQSLHAHGYAVVNPFRVRRFTEAIGHFDKSDRVDSAVLAASERSVPDWHRPCRTADNARKSRMLPSKAGRRHAKADRSRQCTAAWRALLDSDRSGNLNNL